MKYYSDCTTCGTRHKTAEGSTQCRPCRGWHDCTKCGKRLKNEEYLAYTSNGEPRRLSWCPPCDRKYRKNTRKSRSEPRRTTTTTHTTRRSIMRSYRIQPEERPLVERVLEATRVWRPVAVSRAGKRPDHPTPLAILEEAGYGFDLRISQAVLELYRLEIQQEKAA